MILVAGGTGFIGGAIVRELVGRGERVIVMSHRTERARSRSGAQCRGARG